MENYDRTIYVEEAIHRLVEIHYHLGLEQEAKEYAKILGYNYNSSEWFKKSYKVLNKDYKIISKKEIDPCGLCRTITKTKEENNRNIRYSNAVKVNFRMASRVRTNICD